MKLTSQVVSKIKDWGRGRGLETYRFGCVLLCCFAVVGNSWIGVTNSFKKHLLGASYPSGTVYMTEE